MLRVLIVCLLLLKAQVLWAQAGALVFDTYQERIFQLRIIDQASNSKASIGSGFVVNDKGWVVSNYHVVAQALHYPERYRIEITQADGSYAQLEVIGVDVIQDLALLKGGPLNSDWIPLAQQPVAQGDTLYSIGNPHDLGMTLVEGNYNGLLAHSFYPRILFSGSLNPGMSGGPALNDQGELVGVNVATSGEQISFLVPVSAVQALLKQGEVAKDKLAALITQQLHRNEKKMMQAILTPQWPTVQMGQARVAAQMNPYFRCWGGREEDDKALYLLVYNRCNGNDSIFLSDTFRTGMASYAFYWLESSELNSWQFYQRYQQSFIGARAENQASSKDVSEFNCKHRFVGLGTTNEQAVHEFKVVFCQRSYKNYPGLVDLMLMAASVDSKTTGLIAHANLSGVSTQSALAFSRKFLEHLSWK